MIISQCSEDNAELASSLLALAGCISFYLCVGQMIKAFYPHVEDVVHVIQLLSLCCPALDGSTCTSLPGHGGPVKVVRSSLSPVRCV